MYDVRLCDVASTPWRRSDKTRPQAEFENTEKFESFYVRFQGQVPELLAQRIFEGSSVCVLDDAGEAQQCGTFDRVEVVLFSLPFPANQIVATLVLDFSVDDLTNDEDSLLAALLKGMAESRMVVDGKRVDDLADALAQQVGAVPEEAADPGESPLGAGRDRYALVYSDGAPLPPAADSEVIPGLLFGIRWPFRAEFCKLDQPEELNREAGTFAAVSDHTSFFHAQPGPVEASVLLTTVQAVGTSARFQRIWRDAYYHVTVFQQNKQSPETGKQTRKDLESLADEMGNLELDLAFSVQTAADLGLGSTTAQVDAFHQALYDAMQIRTRARTVGQMFVRLSGSIRSELTAIESREKEEEAAERRIEDDRRFRGALGLGLLSFVLAPLTVILGFFGVNAREVDANDTMFDLHRYWPIYSLALVLMAAAVLFAVTFDPAALRRLAERRLHLWRRQSTVDLTTSSRATTESVVEAAGRPG
jgi:hypothetical protein